jgi:Subtilase family
MSQHLLLPDPYRLPSRRAGGSGGGGPNRQPPQHGRHLQQQLTKVVRAPRRIDLGVDPDLVFKVRAVSRPADSAFEGRGLQILGETADYTYFVLAEDQGRTLTTAIDRYAVTGDQRSFFDAVEDIEPYGPDDRCGPGLEDTKSLTGTHTVDVSVWPSGNYEEATRRVGIVVSVLATTRSQVLLRSVSARRTFLRVDVSAAGLQDLLETSVVELVRTPPVPFLDFRDWRNLSGENTSRSDLPGADVGVLDDAPTDAHPLLVGLVRSVDSLAPPSYQWQKQGSHGTEVLGRVLYPNLQEELRDIAPLTAVGAVRVVRILEPDPRRPGSPPRFATYGFPHEIVEQAIRHLRDAYQVRVFNLSFGYAEPFNDLHVGPLTEVIDDLVRELNVVIVVPTGNAGTTLQGRTVSGHHVLDDKPEYFFTPEHRLSEPGPAALAVTVGSIALSGAAAELPHRVGWQAVSGEDEISAFSRTGPGVGTTQRRLNKPDVTHYGGNLVLNDSGLAVANDLGAGIVTTSLRSQDGRLFASVNGTSYAVPAVARVAADITHAYPEASANLIRALLVSSARQPSPALNIAQQHQRAAMYGQGLPSTTRAINSDAKRTTMTYDGSMPIDTVQIHPLPVPEVFRRGSGGERSISVALAFDPPVRRQRREYLASAMKVDIYRDIDPDELSDILIKQDPDDSRDLINDRRRLDLAPGSNSFTNSTLHVRRWTARNSFINDDEIFFLVVTSKAQTWARNDSEYQEQSYALAVTLDDQYLVQADLHQLLTQQVRVPARVRIRL